ncbi:MAG TPA: hypothetical protein VM901_03540 [Bdellovibrionota bacterium]|nr:hypothetical protein [Bdellovibrionota bacterium]
MRETKGMWKWSPFLLVWATLGAVTSFAATDNLQSSVSNNDLPDLGMGPVPVSTQALQPRRTMLPETSAPSVMPSSHPSLAPSAPPPSKESHADTKLDEATTNKINDAIAKTKLARVSAIRELANLIACPKIDPKAKPKLYPQDTQIYYLGRIFQAYRNTNLKILRGLSPLEIEIMQKDLSEEAFKRDFAELLGPLYNSPKVKTGDATPLSKLSDATAVALSSIFYDASERFRSSAQITTKAVDDGSLFKETPAQTLKRSTLTTAEGASPHYPKFTAFFNEYRADSKTLYVDNQRSTSLSQAGQELCKNLDSNKKSHERWENPKLENRVDTSKVDGTKSLEKIKEEKSRDENHKDEQITRPNGLVNADAVSVSALEDRVLAAVRLTDPAVEDPQAAPAPAAKAIDPATLPVSTNYDREIEDHFKGDITKAQDYVFKSTPEVLQAREKIFQESINHYKKLLKTENPETLAGYKEAKQEALAAIMKKDNFDRTKVSPEQEKKYLEEIKQRLETNTLNTLLKQSKTITDEQLKAENLKIAKAMQINTNNLIVPAFKAQAKSNWEKIDKSQLSDHQRYYLAWAYGLMSQETGIDKDGKSNMLAVYLGEDKFLKGFQKFTPTNLEAAIRKYGKQGGCVICVQPMREIDLANPNRQASTDPVKQAMLNGGGVPYAKIRDIDPKDDAITNAPEIFYNLSVAMNYLSSPQGSMPDLKMEPEKYLRPEFRSNDLVDSSR